MASRSSLEYVSSVALVFPTLVAVVDDEERSRVLSALAIISKLAQVTWCVRPVGIMWTICVAPVWR